MMRFRNKRVFRFVLNKAEVVAWQMKEEETRLAQLREYVRTDPSMPWGYGVWLHGEAVAAGPIMAAGFR